MENGICFPALLYVLYVAPQTNALKYILFHNLFDMEVCILSFSCLCIYIYKFHV